MAEGVLRVKLEQAGLGGDVLVDSAGTHGFHRGAAADPRAVAQAALRGYRIAGLKSRPVVAADFSRFDMLLAMDQANLASLRERCPPLEQHRLHLLLACGFDAPDSLKKNPGAARLTEVPDPYYGSVAGFDAALDLIEPACDDLLRVLRRRLAGTKLTPVSRKAD